MEARRRVSERRSPTLKEIADVVGAHASTVSRALRATTTGDPPSESVLRIRRVAEEMGYKPNYIAAGLRTHRTRTIGVVMPRLADGVIAVLCQAIESAAMQAGYQILLSTPPDEVNAQLRSVEMLINRQVDGLMVSSLHLGRDEMVETILAHGVPTIAVNRRGPSSIPSVTADDFAGGCLAAEHLLSLGHSRVGVIAGPRHASTAWDRTCGFKSAMEAAGFPVDDALVVHSDFEVDGGVQGTTQLLKLTEPVSAIFAVNDTAAIGAIGAARDKGLSIPDDLSLIGYNDTPLSSQLPVPLTTVRSPNVEMGTTAVEHLLRGLNGTEIPSATLPVSLIIRESAIESR